MSTCQYTSIILNLCFVMSVFLFCRNIFTALAMISHGGGPETRVQPCTTHVSSYGAHHVMRFISFDNILHVRCVISVSCLCHITDITDITVYFFHVVDQLGQSFCVLQRAKLPRSAWCQKRRPSAPHNEHNTPGNALNRQSFLVISSHLQSSPIRPQNLLSLNLTRMSRSNDSFKFSWVRWSDSEGMLMGMWAQCWKLEIEWMVNERLKWWNVVKRGETSLSNCLSKRLSVVRRVVHCLRGKSSRSASHRGLGCLAWRVQQVARYLTETEI